MSILRPSSSRGHVVAKADSMYYQVITVLLLFPWAILAITILGHFSTRQGRKRRSTLVPSGCEPVSHPTAPHVSRRLHHRGRHRGAIQSQALGREAGKLS